MTEAPPIKVCVVTASRSEYGLMRCVLRDLADDARFELSLVVAGAHLDAGFGMTVDEIEADGFAIDARVPASFGDGSALDLATAIGTMTDGLARGIAAIGPDLVLVMGDRNELLAVAAACLVLTIPIGHISGGEVTEGAIDEQVRHAMTKMAHLHFVANETYGGRVRQMGEEAWRVCVSGEPGLDNVRRLELMDRDELSRALGLGFSAPTALVTYHPATVETMTADDQAIQLIDALERAGLEYVVTYPNPDPGSDSIIRRLEDFCRHAGERAVIFKNLGQKRYLSTLKHATMMVGNSSSAVYEAPLFNLPAVNIGDRQKGRMCASNIIDAACETESIVAGIDTALHYDRSRECEKLYGDGRSSGRIVDFIAGTFAERDKGTILRKSFVDQPGGAS